MPLNNYPQEITEREQALGFAPIQIENPDAPFGGTLFCTAVAKIVGPSVCVFKHASFVDGSIHYKVMCYGVHADGQHDTPKWHPMGSAAPADPELAIFAAQRGPSHTPYKISLHPVPTRT